MVGKLRLGESFENKYYVWRPIEPNKHGLLFYQKHKESGVEWLEHASTARFPIIDGRCTLGFIA